MEMNRAKAVVMVVVLGMLAGRGTGQQSFQECYTECFILCFIIPGNSVFSCSVQCLKDCIIPSASHTRYYCKLGCASSLCTNLSTQTHPNGEKVEGCVNSCSETCTKNY